MARMFFHVGMHKTGTTFLQREVYPRWQGIIYIPRDNLELILRADPSHIRLLSREGLSGRNWDSFETRDRSIQRLSELFPGAGIMISFRRHAAYIASSYNHYVQHGGTLRFDEYFDIEGDRGLMKKRDFRYMERIQRLEKHFGSRPFVFFFEETFNALDTLLADMARFIGGTPPQAKDLNHHARNPSVQYYPLKILRRINSFARTELNPDGRLPLFHWRLRKLGIDPRTICQYWLRVLPNHPVLSPDVASVIDEYYSDDWQEVHDYAKDRDSLARLHT